MEYGSIIFEDRLLKCCGEVKTLELLQKPWLMRWWTNFYVKCPNCGMENNIWFKGNTPPLRHRVKNSIANWVLDGNGLFERLRLKLLIKQLK